MEVSSVQHHQGDEEEFVLLDLNSVSGQLDIPSNAPYVLSGLDTLNPVLIIDDKLKLIGEYEETIGTCLVFTEEDTTPVVHEETGPSEANLFSGKCIIDPNGAPSKGVKPVARLHKILKFRLAPDADNQFATSEQTEQV
ncbi:general transcription factor 3C polypeptide 6 isoform X2 [Juglans microcarpa x Juglans regia]|uniref:general transcription factor 3C polypeptide 6 isoform X2 n=1 Tax=Juglans microcarpa x Juglans regia TaxID=2249226 RepID=UPI001B7E8EF1|nr:general transcription factor 3C polypeptide 6 isoform X2 [Juglans microcarpa x Juglans regia]